MAKLRDKAASQILSGLRSVLNKGKVEVYECDKGDGQMVFVEEGELLPQGWVTKRGPKGVFHYCPAHNTTSVKANPFAKKGAIDNGDDE